MPSSHVQALYSMQYRAWNAGYHAASSGLTYDSATATADMFGNFSHDYLDGWTAGQAARERARTA